MALVLSRAAGRRVEREALIDKGPRPASKKGAAGREDVIENVLPAKAKPDAVWNMPKGCRSKLLNRGTRAT